MSDTISKLQLSGIPSYMHDGIKLYIEHGIMPGSFLTAVFANDFMEMCRRADDINQRAFFEYGRMIYSAPIGCHGSIEKVKEWAKHGGLDGLDG